jgi:branched-chain amino acid transport system permease protein
MFPATVVTALAVGFIGVLMYWLVFGPLRRRGMSALVPMVASLGVMTIIQSILALIYGSHYKSIPGTSDIPTFNLLFGARITMVQVIIFLTGVISCWGLMWMTFHTKFGRSIVALSDSHDMARIVGINPDRSIAWVFFVGAALAGVSGVLVAYDVGVEPAMGMELLLKGAIASIIGGVGQLWGAISGGFVLGTIENFGIWKLPVEWKSAIAFVALIVFLLVRPEGIFRRK